MKKLALLIFVMAATYAHGQVTSTKKGDIEFGGNTIVEMEKYEGNAQTRPKFRMVNAKKDTVLLIQFRKEFAYDWMILNFAKEGKTIEVNTNEIIKGLNYQKNIGSFLVDRKIFDSTGNINAESLTALTTKYSENLTEKYKVLNEGNRLVASTKFDYQCGDQTIHVNGQKVGIARVPANEQMNFNGIEFKDLNNKVIASGNIGPFGGSLKTFDGKEIKLGMPGKTTDCGNTMNFVVSILRELFKNGYYRV